MKIMKIKVELIPTSGDDKYCLHLECDHNAPLIAEGVNRPLTVGICKLKLKPFVKLGENKEDCLIWLLKKDKL